MKKVSPLDLRMPFAFGSAIVALLVAGAISYRVMIVSAEGNHWVDHTHAVLEDLANLLAGMERVDSGARGFILTGEDSYVESYHVGRESAAQSKANIRTLTSDNPIQQRRLPALDSLVAAKFQLAEKAVALRRSGNLAMAVEVVQEAPDHVLMDHLRLAILDMRDEELRLLVLREATAKRRLIQAKIVLISGMGMSLLIALAAGWRVQHETSRGAVAQVELREGEERFHTLANNISQLAWMADEKGWIFWYNERWFDYTGTTLEQMAGWGWQKVHHPDHLQGVVDKITRCFLTGETWDDTFPLRGRDGSYRWFLSRAVPIRDAQGKVLRWFGTSTDITEQVGSDARLRRVNDDLIEQTRCAHDASLAKSNFLATMSHEIRTPMNGVIGMTGLLLHTTLTPEQQEYVTTINNCGEALLAIINDILDFSKIEANKLELDDVDFDLYSTIEECAQSVAGTAHSKGLEMILPVRSSGMARVRGDQGRFRQILLNLLANAVKFTSIGEVAITVDLQASHDGTPMTRIQVRDTGIGISVVAQSQLFTAFTQADSSTTRRFGGTGLGLAISKRLVELMNGRIGIVSEEGHGSTFWFTIQVGRSPLQIAEPPRQSGKTLLVVDDNETNRRVLQLQLERNGYSSLQAGSAPEALQMLIEQAKGPSPFDAVLTDLRMPDVDGFALVKSIRRDPRFRKLPIMMLSSQEDREDARQAGVDEMLPKPAKESQLVSSIERLFAPKRNYAPSKLVKSNVGETVPCLRGRVLVAEDNVVNQKVIGLTLKRLGYESDLVSNGREALSALQVGRYNVVLMDCQMPVMDGFEATGLIRSSRMNMSNIPIIALTANALEGDRDKCIAAGMSDYLSKPISPTTLNKKLEEWMVWSESSVAVL